MNPYPELDPLRRWVDQLKWLLDDPQPGLCTWHEAMHNVRKQIWEFSTKSQ